jgi:hypothetical protein
MSRPTHDRLVALRQTSWNPREGKKGGGKTWPASFFIFDAESPFHGGNTGSNPVGDANKTKDLLESSHFAMGLKGFDNRKSLLESMFSRQFLSRQQNHFHQLRLCSTLG